MKDFILNYMLEQEALSIDRILLNMAVAIVLAGLIYATYRFTYGGVAYSGKFNTSLVMLVLVTTIVMTVISNNLSLSLGMVGALSIIRFRTAIKDPRDAVFIFWCIAVGICCGTAQYLASAVGSAVLVLVLVLFGKIHDEGRFLIIVRCARASGAQVESLLFQQYGKLLLRVRNTTEEDAEYIYELRERTMQRAQKAGKGDVIEALYAIAGVQAANIISQSDDMSL